MNASWLVFVVSLFCFLLQASGDYGTKMVCEGLSKGSSDRSILSIAMIKDRIHLITADLWIYDLPYLNLNTNTHTLSLSVPPVQLQDKWPALTEPGFLKPDGRHTASVVYDYNIQPWYIFAGADSDCLAYQLGEANASLVKFPCMTDVVRGPDTQRPIGFVYCHFVFFGFCSLMASAEGSANQMMQLELTGETISASTRIKTEASTPYKSLCYSGDSKDEVMFSPNCSQATDFGVIQSGIVFNKTWYLLGMGQVYAFPESQHRSVPLTRVKFADFFLCSHSSTETLIIVIMCVVVFTIICPIGYVGYGFISKRRVAKQSKETNTVKTELSHHGTSVAAWNSSSAQPDSSSMSDRIKLSSHAKSHLTQHPSWL